MNIILPDDCFEVFSRQGSHLITYHYVNPQAFLARAGHNILHMRGFQVSNIWNTKHFLKCFSVLSTPLLFTRLNPVQRVLAARVRMQTFSLHPSREEPKILVFTVKETLVFLLVSEHCFSLMLWSSALFCCHLAKRRKVYHCLFHWIKCVGNEREKEAGRSLHQRSLTLHYYADNWNGLKGEKKSRRLFCLEGRRAMKLIWWLKTPFACRAGGKLTRQTWKRLSIWKSHWLTRLVQGAAMVQRCTFKRTSPIDCVQLMVSTLDI